MHSDKKDAPTRFLCPARQNKIEQRSEFQLTQKRGASTIKVTKREEAVFS